MSAASSAAGSTSVSASVLWPVVIGVMLKMLSVQEVDHRTTREKGAQEKKHRHCFIHAASKRELAFPRENEVDTKLAKQSLGQLCKGAILRASDM